MSDAALFAATAAAVLVAIVAIVLLRRRAEAFPAAEPARSERIEVEPEPPRAETVETSAPAPPSRPGEHVDLGEDDDITLVTVHADLLRLRAQLANGGDVKRAFAEDDYLDYVVEEIDEDLEPTARAHGLIADHGADQDVPTMSTNAFLVSAARQTDQGQRRARNEDRYLCLDDDGVFFVADGMGGYAGGDIAAQLAVDTIADAFRERRFEAKVQSDLPRRPTELAQAMQMANLAIWEMATDDAKLRGMGTTLVGARFALRKKRVYIGHIGDSRCYRMRDGELRQLTMDHTLASYGVEGPTRHRLVRAVGIGAEVEIDLIVGVPRIGDVYLLCSDGLNKMVRDGDIREVLGSTSDLDDASKKLVELANARGGKDNITVVLVAVRPPSEIFA